MALLPKFETPALIRDAPPGSPFYTQWSGFVSSLIPAVSPGDNGGAFYNPMLTDVDVAGEKFLTWIGFPRDVMLSAANRDDHTAAFVQADADVALRSRQNEYFEWYVHRVAGKIQKVTFVTETPEYYRELFNFDPNIVLNLYRTLVNPAVTLADIAPGGSYNIFNVWNTTQGIVHYIQTINTLPAATGLSRMARTSSPPFRDNFEARPALATQPTAVDPRVSFDVHMLVRKGLHVSLRDPVGLYIVGWNGSGLAHPDGTPAGNYWRIVRGVPGMVLRLEYEVPAGLGFSVGDMTLGGRRIEYGGQLAEQITVGICGIAGLPAGGRRSI